MKDLKFYQIIAFKENGKDILGAITGSYDPYGHGIVYGEKVNVVDITGEVRAVSRHNIRKPTSKVAAEERKALRLLAEYTRTLSVQTAVKEDAVRQAREAEKVITDCKEKISSILNSKCDSISA